MSIIVVTGMARGGTTFAGKVIAEATSRPQQGEILNPNDYPVPEGFQVWQNDPPIGYLRWYFEQVMQPRAVLKDPFLARYTSTLRANWTQQIIAMVRHPAAIAHSYARMNWQFSSQHLPVVQHREQHMRIAAVYQMLYEELLADDIPVFRAEDLARNPGPTLTRMLNALGEEGDTTVADKYLDQSFGVHLGGAMHKFRRSPEAMDNWKRSPMAEHADAIMCAAPVASVWY